MSKEISISNVELMNKVDNYFGNLLSPISKKHINVCNCQKHRYKEIYDKLFDDTVKELHINDLYDNESIRSHRLSIVKDLAVNELVRVCEVEDIRCDVERDVIKLNLSLFDGSFDISNAKVFIIVKKA